MCCLMQSYVMGKMYALFVSEGVLEPSCSYDGMVTNANMRRCD